MHILAELSFSFSILGHWGIVLLFEMMVTGKLHDVDMPSQAGKGVWGLTRLRTLAQDTTPAGTGPMCEMDVQGGLHVRQTI